MLLVSSMIEIVDLVTYKDMQIQLVSVVNGVNINH